MSVLARFTTRGRSTVPVPSASSATLEPPAAGEAKPGPFPTMDQVDRLVEVLDYHARTPSGGCLCFIVGGTIAPVKYGQHLASVLAAEGLLALPDATGVERVVVPGIAGPVVLRRSVGPWHEDPETTVRSAR